MIRHLAIAAMLLGAGCSQQEAAAPPANEAAVEPSAAPAANEVPALEGQWNVAAIDGKPTAAASAMTASFAGGKVTLVSGCLRRAWTYTQNRNVVSFTSDPGGSANCGGASPSGEQETAYAALQQASIAIFDKDGREANLSGTGGNLTLQRR
jgi:hypothetical protein